MVKANSDLIDVWNTILFQKFLRFKHLLIEGPAVHSGEALARIRHQRAHVCSTSAAVSAIARD